MATEGPVQVITGEGAGGGSAAERRPPSALPCPNSNNSIDELTGGHKRTAFALKENVRLLGQKFGLSRLGFLTLTFRDHVTDIREAQRRFNSLRTNVLAKRYAASIAVVERQKSGRIHFHLLIVCPEDIRTGFDFAAVDSGDYKSANRWLRGEWSFWRATAPKYRFGRTELLPVKKDAESLAAYVGKYIAKHVGARIDADRGARLVRYTVNARMVGTRFAWKGIGPWLWRAKLKKFAEQQGCDSMEHLKAKFGHRWAYHYREHIEAIELDHWVTCHHYLRDVGGFLPDDVDLNGPISTERIQCEGDEPELTQTDIRAMVKLSNERWEARRQAHQRPQFEDIEVTQIMSDGRVTRVRQRVEGQAGPSIAVGR